MRLVTDGGAKASGYGKEKNDCAVVAFSLALGISYKDAYKKLDAAGRQKNSGFYINEFMEHCGFLGYNTKTIKFKKGRRLTQNEFAITYNKGKWIAYTKGHVIAVINGVIFDNNDKPARGKVLRAWRFTKTT